MEKIIKKVLRKWLKKKLYNSNSPLDSNVAHFEWVYNSPLHQWRDRIWVVTHNQHKGVGGYDSCMDYLTNNSFQLGV